MGNHHIFLNATKLYTAHLDMLLQLQDCVSGLQDQTAAGTIQTDEQLHAGLLGTAWMK